MIENLVCGKQKKHPIGIIFWEFILIIEILILTLQRFNDDTGH